MSNGVTKALLVVGALAITAVLARFIFFSSESLRDIRQQAFHRSGTVEQQLNEDHIVRFDGMEVTGNEIVEIISALYSEDVLITVEGVVDPFGYSPDNMSRSDSGSRAEAVKRARENVNARQLYKGEIRRGEAGEILELFFRKV